MDVSPVGWGALILGIIALLTFDLKFAHRHPENVSMREATLWSIVWMLLGIAFTLVILAFGGSEPAQEYLAGFLTEKALSLDNVFVIIVLIASFAVADHDRGKVLTFGIAGALALRAIFIIAGAALLNAFHPMIYVFGALLLFTGIRLAIKSEEPEDEHDSGPLKLVRKILPGASPIVAALAGVAIADVIFAIDSVPAVLAITTNTFIVFAANAFALLGLRALYFLLDGMADRFAYLHYGLAALLIFIGLKMVLSDVVHLSPAITLPVIVLTLGISIVASLRRKPTAASH
jgi:tellurite resistance protein TerC